MILERARSQRVFITLLGPRNETLTGQLNMSDFQPMGPTGGHHGALASAKNDDLRQYDSRGAAYYICVFILVYALAIVVFVASLAKRRRFEQNGDFSRLPKSDILHYYSTEAAVVPIRETTGTAAAAEQMRRSKDGTGSGIHPVGLAPGSQEAWATASAAPNDPPIGTRRKGDAMSSTPDELITLVQVLPCGGGDDDEPRLDNYWTEGKEADESYPELDQRCRWSIGPDGNLFILQVDENDSGTKFSLNDDDDDEGRERIVCTRIPVQKPGHEKNAAHGSSDAYDRQNAPSANASDVTGSRSISHDNLTSSSCEQQRSRVFGCSPGDECSSKEGAAAVNAISKCNSVSFFQHGSVLTDNNYNCDFGNPWSLPNNYPEIQKLLHVTSV